MKKLLKKVSLCFVSLLTLIGVVGCSCSRQINVKYTVNLTNEFGSIEKAKINMMTIIEKKFREPANTPCYQKKVKEYTISDEIMIIENFDLQSVINVVDKKFNIGNVGYQIIEENGEFSKIKDLNDVNEYEVLKREIQIDGSEKVIQYYFVVNASEYRLSRFKQVNYENEKVVVTNNKFILSGVEYLINDIDSKIESIDNSKSYELKNNKFKIETYVLMNDSRGVSDCYTETGEYFEKAVSNNVDKVVLKDNEHPLNISNSNTTFESEALEVPKEKKHSLIYTFEIKNRESVAIYIKELTINSILNGQINEDGLSKIKASFPKDKIVKLDDQNYYRLLPSESIFITLELKGLERNDSVENKKELNLNIDLIVRK